MSIKHSFGNLPKDFFILTLDEISEKITDGTHSTPTYVEKGGVPFYSVENVVANNFTKTKLIPHELHEKLCSRIQPKKGDLLLTRIGSVGKTKLIDWEVNASIYVSLALIRLQKNINKEYVYQFTKSDFFQQEIKKRSLLNATPMKINLGEIGKIPVPFPSCIIEQQKIAEVLSTVDKKIDLIDQKIAETEKLKTGLMQKLFSEGVGVQGENGEWQPHTEFQYDSLLGKKPKSWQTETLGNILDIASSKRIKREEYVNEGVPFYRSKEIILKSKQLSFTPEIFISRERFDKLSEKFGSPQQGDILISAVGTIGAIYRVRDEEFYFKDGNLLWIRNIDKSGLSSEFLECYFRSYLCQEMLANLSAGSSQNALTIVKLSKLPLIIPTKDEQKMIVSIISSINEKIYLLKAQKSETQQLKKGLMQKLLTGEWRVPVEETEAA
ncbi:restriction endonuclease subunit S [Vibrio alginolyticus]|uniref:restriction endonuclease subunit S n=1 Tax=Vibrio alginolyticus TaxID=663 RepID=UPI00215C37D9|nr:restriction endonuclease subunit S [Vibrio alginolyticus]EJV5742601.1 restriction endonuclease subunit S [Vibrio alginolyticus]MCR9451861.1 restriction endonuclease subunit S [Vibrio alginolyticus]MCR9461438.1 restriction endonuclease subunit S [Vibrio alginolyticus]